MHLPAKPFTVPSRKGDTMRFSRLRMLRFASILVVLPALLGAPTPLRAQISFTSAIDLALRNSPRVKMAEADVAHARASLEENKDVYIPTVVATSSAIGGSYGFPLGTPTAFSLNAQSLVFSFSQKDYIRAASSGLKSSTLALKDVRDQVAEDVAVTYLSLDRAQQQQAALAQEAAHASQLENIVKDRIEGGQDTPMELTKARRTSVQIRLQSLQLDDEIASFSDHLARVIGLPGPIVAVSSSIPALPSDVSPPPSPSSADTLGVQAAFATARSKREQAFGDARYTWRPQFSFGAQYSRFSTYNNNYALYYPGIQNQPNAVGAEVSILLPMLDMGRRAKARESAAEAVKLEQEAVFDRDQASEGRLKLQHAAAELTARAELASLDRDLAQQQLEVILVQLQSAQASTNGPLMTPKDEASARIQERQRYIDMLDAQYLLRETKIQLLRQTGQLDSWLDATVATQHLGPEPQQPEPQQ
jgi:outer membrane protein TolC